MALIPLCGDSLIVWCHGECQERFFQNRPRIGVWPFYKMPIGCRSDLNQSFVIFMVIGQPIIFLSVM